MFGGSNVKGVGEGEEGGRGGGGHALYALHSD